MRCTAVCGFSDRPGGALDGFDELPSERVARGCTETALLLRIQALLLHALSEIQSAIPYFREITGQWLITRHVQQTHPQLLHPLQLFFRTGLNKTPPETLAEIPDGSQQK